MYNKKTPIDVFLGRNKAFVAGAVAAENYYICVLPLAHLEYLMG